MGKGAPLKRHAEFDLSIESSVHAVKTVINSAQGHELLMGSFFHNAVLSQDQNQIRVPYGSEAVGDGKGSAALRQFLQGALHQLFALVIQGRGGFVQNQNRRVFQENPGDADPLLLPSGKLYAPLSHIGVIAVGQVRDELVGAGKLSGADDFFLSGARLSVCLLYTSRCV